MGMPSTNRPTTSRQLIDSSLMEPGLIESRWETAPTAGAVAICRLRAKDAGALDRILSELTGVNANAIGSISHAKFGEIDDGLVVRISATTALLMPHGGPRIVARLDGWMAARGVVEGRGGNQDTFLEAQDSHEALALHAIATAASPRAIPLLLAQSQRAEAARVRGWIASAHSTPRDSRLAHLLNPPRIVAVGAANVGKSSLLNAVAARTVAIAMDFAGTTRDAVAARVELDGLVVDWFDTPGIRASDDEIERAAQGIAHRLRAGANLVLEVSAPGMPCPMIEGDAPRLRACTRIDLDPAHDSAEARAATVHVSATERIGLPELAIAVRRALISDEDLSSEDPWDFHEAPLKVP